MDGHPPSQGWSSTIQNMVSSLPKDGHLFSKLWSQMIPRMVKPHPQECYPPTKGLSPTNPRKDIHHHQDGNLLAKRYGWTPSPEWSSKNCRMVTHHINDGQLDLEFDSSPAQQDSWRTWCGTATHPSLCIVVSWLHCSKCLLSPLTSRVNSLSFKRFDR